MSRRRPGIWRDARGAAMAEAVIVLPVFIALFALGLHLLRVFQADQAMAREARRELWSQALPGCRPGEPDLAIQDQLEIGDFNLRARAHVPTLAPLFDTIRTELAQADPTGEIQRPSVLGGGQLTVGADLTVECNEPYPYQEDASRDPEALLFQAVRVTWCKFAQCGGSPMECSRGQSACLGHEYEQVCVGYEGSGVWDVPTRCEVENLEVCVRGRCEACDPELPPGAVVGPEEKPPCPEGVGGRPEEL